MTGNRCMRERISLAKTCADEWRGPLLCTLDEGHDGPHACMLVTPTVYWDRGARATLDARAGALEVAIRAALRLLRGEGPISGERADEVWHILRPALDGEAPARALASAPSTARCEASPRCPACAHGHPEAHDPGWEGSLPQAIARGAPAPRSPDATPKENL
jgi:hypothetical protein